MQTYIALLRGINVSGVKKIKMADLRAMLEDLGLIAVTTYIQSGNIIFKSENNSVQELADQIKSGIQEVFGFDVPVFVKTKSEIMSILKESPYRNPEDLEAKRIYYAVLGNAPEHENSVALEQKTYPNELFKITSTCVYLNCTNGAGNAKLTNNVIERKLKVKATSRNHRTMLNLIELAEKI